MDQVLPVHPSVSLKHQVSSHKSEVVPSYLSVFDKELFLSSIDVFYRGCPRTVYEVLEGIDGVCKVRGNITELVYQGHRPV